LTLPKYPIETARLLLRPFEDRDFGALFDFYSRPEVVQFLYWDVRTRGETREVLAQKMLRITIAGQGTSLNLAVMLKETNKVIGDVSLALRNTEFQQGEIGFVFNPDYYGQGYATEATIPVMTLGFNDFNMHRIYGRCDVRNHGSYKLMERMGMRREAHFIHNEIFKGEWGDEYIYAILEDEWRELHK
jgi:RimJ/RimL family protein N-acetyltransferase